MNPPYTMNDPNRVKINTLGEAQNWRCAYCGILCHGDHNTDAAASRDHVVPKTVKGASIYALLDWANEIMACRLCNNHRGALPARTYFQMVRWKGREKAARWASRRRKRWAKQRSESRGQSPLAAKGSELGFQQFSGEGCA
jgi:5-methylcytosine-specific restriction endonuclease McrA